MRLQRLLNRMEKFKSFAICCVKLEVQNGEWVLLERIQVPKRNRPRGSECGVRSSAHDNLRQREIEYVPL